MASMDISLIPCMPGYHPATFLGCVQVRSMRFWGDYVSFGRIRLSAQTEGRRHADLRIKTSPAYVLGPGDERDGACTSRY